MMIDTCSFVNILDSIFIDNIQKIEISPPDKKIYAFETDQKKSSLLVVGKLSLKVHCTVKRKVYLLIFSNERCRTFFRLQDCCAAWSYTVYLRNR